MNITFKKLLMSRDFTYVLNGILQTLSTLRLSGNMAVSTMTGGRVGIMSLLGNTTFFY